MKDYIHENSSDDPLLSAYISLVLQAENTDVDVFGSTFGILDRPMFFERYFRVWVTEAFEELEKYIETTTKTAKDIMEQVTPA